MGMGEDEPPFFEISTSPAFPIPHLHFEHLLYLRLRACARATLRLIAEAQKFDPMAFLTISPGISGQGQSGAEIPVYYRLGGIARRSRGGVLMTSGAIT